MLQLDGVLYHVRLIYYLDYGFMVYLTTYIDLEKLAIVLAWC